MNKWISEKTFERIKNLISDDNGKRCLIRNKIYECNCPKCGNKYEVSFEEMYRIYNEPFFGMDHYTLAAFETEYDTFNYRLIKLDITGYDKHRTGTNYIYLLLSNEINEPVLITEATANEIMGELNNLYDNNIEAEEAKRLIYNTNMTRTR